MATQLRLFLNKPNQTKETKRFKCVPHFSEAEVLSGIVTEIDLQNNLHRGFGDNRRLCVFLAKENEGWQRWVVGEGLGTFYSASLFYLFIYFN